MPKEARCSKCKEKYPKSELFILRGSGSKMCRNCHPCPPENKEQRYERQRKSDMELAQRLFGK